MELGVLFHFAILLFGGLVFAKIIHYFHLPDVTGYLVGGLILGPSVLGCFPPMPYRVLGLYRKSRLASSPFPSAASLSWNILSAWA